MIKQETSHNARRVPLSSIVKIKMNTSQMKKKEKIEGVAKTQKENYKGGKRKYSQPL